MHQVCEVESPFHSCLSFCWASSICFESQPSAFVLHSASSSNSWLRRLLVSLTRALSHLWLRPNLLEISWWSASPFNFISSTAQRNSLRHLGGLLKMVKSLSLLCRVACAFVISAIQCDHRRRIYCVCEWDVTFFYIVCLSSTQWQPHTSFFPTKNEERTIRMTDIWRKAMPKTWRCSYEYIELRPMNQM